MATNTLHSVSLFSNCGAGDIGYAKAGFRFDVMAELDPRRLEICLLNHPTAVGVPGDLRKTWPMVVDEYLDVAKGAPLTLLAACPPCQGMSSARSHRGKEGDPDAGMKDARNLLVTVISKVARELRPRVIVVENVQAFLTRQVRHPKTKVPISASRWLIDELAEDYAVFPFLTDLCDYGVPQTRKRTFLTFFRLDEPAITILEERAASPYPIPRHAPEYEGRPITLREALAGFNLPSLDARSAETAVSRVGKGLHAVPVWPDRRYDMVAAIPPHAGMGAWENDACPSCGQVEVGKDDAVCPRCGDPLLRPVVKKKRGGYRLITGFRTSTYTRMKSDAPAAAITTASGHLGSNNTIHPFENRLLSTLECALLQTLPKRFKWGTALERWGHTNIRDMIGEAVPPVFTRLHGKVLRALLEGKRRLRLYPASEKRCVRPAKKLGLSTRVKPE
jgi:DNA (cytosine-5)-methyltransferase 1